jgi:hypothetical protein
MFRLASLSLFAMLSIAVPAMGCHNYNLLDRLENPGGAGVNLGGNGSTSCGSDCRIFVTASVYDGILGGAQGADNKCNIDPARPQGTTNWKALISSTSERTACTSANCPGGLAENFNWVLRPNTLYRRLDGQIIGTTNGSAIFDLTFGLQHAMDSNSSSVWTGLFATWVQGSDCNSWTSNDNSKKGASADGGSDTATGIKSTDSNCDSELSLYCVEQ